MLVYHATRVFATGEDPRPSRNIHPLLSPYGYFHTYDGGIVMAVGKDAQFANLCRGIGREDLAASADFATNSSRQENQEKLFEILNQEFSTRSSADLLATLEQVEVPAGEIRKLSQVLDSSEAESREAVLSVIHPQRRRHFPGPRRRMADRWDNRGCTHPTPKLNEHADEILNELSAHRRLPASQEPR